MVTAVTRIQSVSIYIYAFSRRFYPKRLTLHSSYSFYILSALAFPGNRPHNIGFASAMLYYLSYRKVSRSDGGSASRDDLYSPERQRRLGDLDEPQRSQVKDLITYGAFPLHGPARYGSVRFTFGGFSTGYCTWYLVLF